MNFCRCCGKPLGEGEGGQTFWHRKCSKQFFESPSPPPVEISREELRSLALRNLQAGQIVTGVQKKLSLHLSTVEKNYRLTLVGHPAGYILKPPSEDYPELPEFEHASMLLAEAASIPTVPHGLIRIASGEWAYISKRIDRVKGDKIPMEDFCQLAGRLTEDKYRGSAEQCGRIIRTHSSRSGLDLTYLYQVFLFSFLTGNSDMHLKNFSLIRSKTGWMYAPVYDLVPANLLIPEDKEESAMPVHGKKARLSRKDFQALGRSFDLDDKVISGLTSGLLKVLSGKTRDILAQSGLSESGQERFLELIQTRADSFLRYKT